MDNPSQGGRSQLINTRSQGSIERVTSKTKPAKMQALNNS